MLVKHAWGVTDDHRLVDDGGVGQHNRLFATFHEEINLIVRFETAHRHVATKINEMLASDDNLGESGERTAWWVNLIDDWVLVVKIGDGGRVKTLIDLNDEVDLTWLLGGRSETLDLRAGNSRGWDSVLTESACDVT